MEENSTEIKWSNTKKFIFLFFGTYFFLYIFPFPFETSGPPIMDIRLPFYSDAMEQLFLLVGKLFFSSFQLYGESGDTPFGIAQIITYILISTVTASICFIFWRNKINYDKVYEIILIYPRYYLGFFIFLYGAIKLFDLQFGDLAYYELDAKLGDTSSSNLLWTFIKASDGYNYFIGAAQVVAGLLLFFRRTKMIAALLVLSIMINVVVMNICYDVPVKLYSIHLVLITFFIIAPEIVRLFDFFILHKSTQLPLQKLHFEKKYLRISRIFIKCFFILGLPIFSFIKLYDLRKTVVLEGPLDGVYTTQLFIWENDTILPQRDDNISKRWEKFIIEGGTAVIMKQQNSKRYYQTKIDTNLKTLDFILEFDSTLIHKFNYKHAGSNFILDGEWNGSKMYGRFGRKTKEDYNLTNQKIRWIQ